MTGSNTASHVVFLADDVLVDRINSLNVRGIPQQRSHIGHTSIHIASTNGMSPGFSLIDDGLMAL